MAQTKFGMVENETFSTDFLNKRNAHRRRVLKSGAIFINEGFSKFDCVVRNVNENGALLEMSDPTILPSKFDLEIGDAGSLRKVDVVWKENSLIGVSFL